MTDKEIIKALECCMSNSDSIIDEFCEQCPYQSANLQCMDEMVKDAHHLTTCQKSQIEDLYAALDDRIQRIEALEVEVERLEKLRAEASKEVEQQYEQAEADILANMADGGASCHWCINKHRTAAIREFAERLKPTITRMVELMFDDDEGCCQIENCKMPNTVPCISPICIDENKEYWRGVIDTLVKEMTEEPDNE